MAYARRGILFALSVERIFPRRLEFRRPKRLQLSRATPRVPVFLILSAGRYWNLNYEEEFVEVSPAEPGPNSPDNVAGAFLENMSVSKFNCA